MADGIIVINKADGDNHGQADPKQLNFAQFHVSYFSLPHSEAGWTFKCDLFQFPIILGVKEVWDMVYKPSDFVKRQRLF